MEKINDLKYNVLSTKLRLDDAEYVFQRLRGTENEHLAYEQYQRAKAFYEIALSEFNEAKDD